MTGNPYPDHFNDPNYPEDPGIQKGSCVHPNSLSGFCPGHLGCIPNGPACWDWEHNQTLAENENGEIN